MKRLLILRHAKSSWKDPTLDDSDRPLNDRGRRAAVRIGRLLLEERIVPDRVYCSTARRARETADLALGRCEFSGAIEFAADLYFEGAEAAERLMVTIPELARLPLIVGHNPDLEVLVARLTGAELRLPTGALAQLELPIERWREVVGVRGSLVASWTPKGLDES